MKKQRSVEKVNAAEGDVYIFQIKNWIFIRFRGFFRMRETILSDFLKKGTALGEIHISKFIYRSKRLAER